MNKRAQRDRRGLRKVQSSGARERVRTRCFRNQPVEEMGPCQPEYQGEERMNPRKREKKASTQAQNAANAGKSHK